MPLSVALLFLFKYTTDSQAEAGNHKCHQQQTPLSWGQLLKPIQALKQTVLSAGQSPLAGDWDLPHYPWLLTGPHGLRNTNHHVVIFFFFLTAFLLQTHMNIWKAPLLISLCHDLLSCQGSAAQGEVCQGRQAMLCPGSMGTLTPH